ncbi:MAG: hypothetical protein IID46_15070 [Planctomycetes bacterium]|nr:hypothetical protein [Planctomycetota bacterium]
MNWIRQEQINWNAASRDNWSFSSSHRQRVMELLKTDCPRETQRLCVLGAGNCNDLDLSKLVESFCEVHLVDLDGDALQAALERQGMAGHSSIVTHGGIDLTGVCDDLAQYSPHHPPSEIDLRRIIAAADSFRLPDEIGRFETVISTCLLSQLHNAVVRSVGKSHLHFLDMLKAVRHGHLRLLTDLTLPGGRGVLVSDFTSSETVSDLPIVPEAELCEFLVKTLNSGNFFHGLNPVVLASLFKQDSIIAPRVTNVELSKPWRWNFGCRVYAVVSIGFRRQSEP